jgi:hypothetical protein
VPLLAAPKTLQRALANWPAVEFTAPGAENLTSRRGQNHEMLTLPRYTLKKRQRAKNHARDADFSAFSKCGQPLYAASAYLDRPRWDWGGGRDSRARRSLHLAAV